jgi:zinc/manganese transport system permease protein
MPPVVQILGLPFVACVLMSIILGYLGTHVLKREVIFIDIALAQIAAVGSIVAHLAFEAHTDSVLGYICSLIFVLLAAAFYAYIHPRAVQFPLEAIIGISFVVAAAAGLFLVGLAPGGHIHGQQILSGNLLWVGWKEILWSLAAFCLAGCCLYLSRKPLARISADYHTVVAADGKAMLWDFVFYSLLGLVITVAVKTAGVVLVFAYLIIPATISAILCSRLISQLTVAWSAAIAASALGLLFAYRFDFSLGPAIALFLGCELIGAAVGAKIFHWSSR